MARDAVESTRDKTGDERPALLLAAVIFTVPIVVTLLARPTLVPLVALAVAAAASLTVVAWQKRRVRP
jgi:Flp pilus assembly protein TadB